MSKIDIWTGYMYDTMSGRTIGEPRFFTSYALAENILNAEMVMLQKAYNNNLELAIYLVELETE